MSKLTNEERVTIAAAKRWRESLSKEGRGGTYIRPRSVTYNTLILFVLGSFDKWKVLLVVEKSRAEGFTRVLHAGQAQVHVYTGRPMDLQVRNIESL